MDPFGSFGSLWILSGPLGLYRSFFVLMEFITFFWVLESLYASLWILMGPYGSL